MLFSSFTTFRPNFTSGLHQVILPRPRIGMLSLVTVSPVITAFHGPVAQRIEALSLYGSRLAVSNPTQTGQRFTWSKTWCNRQQLWKAGRGWEEMVLECGWRHAQRRWSWEFEDVERIVEFSVVATCGWVFRISTGRDLKHHKMQGAWGWVGELSIAWLAY